MNRVSVFVRRRRIEKLERWTIRAILAEAFFLALFPSVAAGAVIVGILTWFLRLQIDSRFKMRSLPFDVPVTIFVLIGALSVFLSPARSFELIYNYCGLVGIYGLTYLLVGQNIRNYDQIKKLFGALGISAILVVLWGYFQYIFGIDIADMKWVDGEAFPELKKRVFSTLENPNVLAGYLDVFICLLLGLLTKAATRGQKMILVGFIVAFSACLAMTYSRGAFLTMAIIFVFYGILRDKRILLLFLAITGIIVWSDSTFTDRILSIFTSTLDSSEGLRIGIWVSTISMIADHPFAGIGWGAYKFVYPQYNYYLADPDITIFHAHNLFLNVAAEVGIPGALAFFWYFFGTTFSSLSLDSSRGGEKIRTEAAEILKRAVEKDFTPRLVNVFMTSSFLRTLAQSKSMLMTRMSDRSNKLMDMISFTPSEEELRKSGKRDEDISDEEISEIPEDLKVEEKISESEKAEEKNSGVEDKKANEPELVHHEELKWSSPPLAEKISESEAEKEVEDKDDKVDLQKFAGDDEENVIAADFLDKRISEGLKFGIGLAFLSMALNGVTDDLLFNIPSAMLMWQLGALSAAINLVPTEKSAKRRRRRR